MKELFNWRNIGSLSVASFGTLMITNVLTLVFDDLASMALRVALLTALVIACGIHVAGLDLEGLNLQGRRLEALQAVFLGSLLVILNGGLIFTSALGANSLGELASFSGTTLSETGVSERDSQQLARINERLEELAAELAAEAESDEAADVAEAVNESLDGDTPAEEAPLPDTVAELADQRDSISEVAETIEALPTQVRSPTLSQIEDLARQSALISDSILDQAKTQMDVEDPRFFKSWTAP